MSEGFILGLIISVLVYEFVNGFHDAGNALAASVATRAFSFRSGVFWSALFHLAGALTGTGVAVTIGKGLLPLGSVELETLLATILIGLIWNIVTWHEGIPSSSSHAMVGSLVGISLFVHGPQGAISAGFIAVLIGFITLPLVTVALGIILMRTGYTCLSVSDPVSANYKLRRLQRASAAILAFSHGSNDAQKSMGIITLTLFSSGIIAEFMVPMWVKIACALALTLGTAAGGWRIIHTMGERLVKLQPANGFVSDLTAGVCIGAFAFLGLPASTSQAVTAAILGVGLAKTNPIVRWASLFRILIAWCLTMPINAFGGILIYRLIFLIGL